MSNKLQKNNQHLSAWFEVVYIKIEPKQQTTIERL